MDDDLRLYLRSLEEELQSLRAQVADIQHEIIGVGPKSDTSISLRLVQSVNLLVEIRDGFKGSQATGTAVFLLLVVAVAHLWRHW